jgi:ATP-dependent DNA helicase DinG
VARLGPLAVVDLETTGLAEDAGAEILEFGAVLLDPGRDGLGTAHALVRPRGPLPRAVELLTGLRDEDVRGAPLLGELAPAIRRLLGGRTLVAHNASFERHFLARGVDPAFADAAWLDTIDLLALTHPDAPDLRLESFTRSLLGREEEHRALADALDTLRVLSRVAEGARRDEPRHRTARRALEAFAPDSAWLALLGKEEFAPPEAAPDEFVAVGGSREPAVPFEEEAIAAALADEARGLRHFPGYRVRGEQIRLARRFARGLAESGVLLLEGGTGVGKSLAYLAAAIPFAVRFPSACPVAISTRTKLLQDQLLAKDIGAAARMLGHPELRALSIKGRANYACARRLEAALDEGRDARLFPEDRLAYAALLACARTRPHGELGSVPGALLRRFPALRELLHRSVSVRPEQCSREQCAHREDCPFGRRRAALARAHLVVANHDLLLRWPPDYPRLAHVVVDEVHELADVADEVYALEARPEEIVARIDEIFGRPAGTGRGRGAGGRADGGSGGGEASLPARARRRVERDAIAWRRAIQQDLVALGRAASELTETGELDLPGDPGPRFAPLAALAQSAARRLDTVCDELDALAPGGAEAEGTALDRAREDLRQAASVLRLPFDAAAHRSGEQVAAFEALEPPFDRWRLVVRAVDPSEPFQRGFLGGLASFAGVSASLFVGGDAFAALGSLGLEERLGERVQRDSVPSPFPYAEHMRVVALDGGEDLVEETSEAIAELARRLGGRTLGLFTSLRRMNDVAARLARRLRPDGLEVLLPRRASDDPHALVERFRAGGAVLLGARRFWQGLDLPGRSLEAVVIEKLPFEVPTELRKRREARLRERGEDAFDRYTLGRMLLNLKQMTGRLIRTEQDRGVVVIVDARPRMRYFQRLAEALPPGVGVRLVRREELGAVLTEVGIGGAEGAA